MRWTTAWLLALAVHVAVGAAVWLGCRRMVVAPQPGGDAVELAVVEGEAAPRAEAAPRPEPAPKHVHDHVNVNDHVNVHDHVNDHGGGPVHVHVNDHGGDHVHDPEHVRERRHVNVDGPVGVHANGAVKAPVDLNLRPNSLAALAPEPASKGTATLDTATLHGSVAADGTMHIRSKSPVTLGSDLTQPGKALESWLKDPKAHAASRDGTVAIVQGTFDVTDSLMRAHGQDPYRSQRMKMLDETREQRLTLAARDRTARRESQLAALPTELRNIWKDEARSAKERREIIFQLWDECQEPAEGEAEGAAAGARARREIVAFIRERLAEGSQEAYPKEELATLNLARQSRQRFDPYGRFPL
jgi:hypothetical protein